MCIITLKPEKVKFTKGQLKIMWDSNPDGAGFMYAEGGKVQIVKGLMTLDALWNAIQDAGPLRKMVIHFRVKTHGAISQELTHPFWITEGQLGMVHNGVIRPLVNETSETESDTAVFARKFAAAYSNPLLAIKHDFHRDMLEAYIGYSKMVFMDGAGETFILNEQLGEWSENVWYSNDKYKVAKYTYVSKTIGSANDADLQFPWERGKFEQGDREAIQARLEKAFQYEARTDRSNERVTHVTRKSGKGSENAKKRATQKPLLGLPSTGVESRWSRRHGSNED